MPTSTKGYKGLMNAGVRVHTGTITIPATGTIQLPYRVAGFLMLKNGYNWGGYHTYVAYMNTITQVNTIYDFNKPNPVVIDNGYVSVENIATSDRLIRYVIFNITDPDDPADYIQD